MGKEVKAIGWAHVVAFLLALVAALFHVHGHSSSTNRSTVAAQSPHARASASEPAIRQVSRLLYPYSVIPGGVESGQELKDAILRDPVAANHYADFDVAKARVVRLDRDQLAYVSYRLGDRIFWTSKKVKLPKGESVVTDGAHEARTRCGNRVSETPRQPVSPSEPPEALQPSQSPQQVSILLPPAIDFPATPPLDIPPGPPLAPPTVPPGGGVIPPPYFPPVGGGGSPPTTPVVPPPISVPEPGSLEMLGFGIAAILAGGWLVDFRRRRRA